MARLGRTDKKYLPRSGSGSWANFVEIGNFFAAFCTLYFLFSSNLFSRKTDVNAKNIGTSMKLHLLFKYFFNIRYMTPSMINNEIRDSKKYMAVKTMLYTRKIIGWKRGCLKILQFSDSNCGFLKLSNFYKSKCWHAKDTGRLIIKKGQLYQVK